MLSFLDNLKLHSIYGKNILKEENEGSNGIDPEYDISNPEIFKKFEIKLVRAKLRLLREHPFFGVILQKLKTVPTYDVPTMGVDNAGNIYINPKYVMSDLDNDEVMGDLAHEVLHIANLTFFRQKGRDHQQWNIATDFIMNRDIMINGIKLHYFDTPANSCMAELNNGKWPSIQGGRWVVAPNQMTGDQPLDITDLTAEQLYNIIEQNKQKQDQNQNQNNQQNSGNNQPDPNNGQNKQTPNPTPKTRDTHITQGESKPEKANIPSTASEYTPTHTPTEQDAKNLVKEKIATAIDEIRKRGLDGSIPRSFSLKELKPKVNWKQLLKQFITSTERSSYNWSRPNKRALVSGYYAPSQKIDKEEIDIVAAIDTSGSISNHEVQVFFNEVLNILKTVHKAKILLMLWNVDVYSVTQIETPKESIETARNRLKQIKVQSGGTILSSVANKLNQLGIKKIKGVIYLTDGYVEEHAVLPKSDKIMFLVTQEDSQNIMKNYKNVHYVDVND